MNGAKKNMMRIRTKRKLHWLHECIKRVVKHGCNIQRVYVVMDEKKLIYLANSKAANSSIKASVLSLPEQTNYHAIHGLARKSGHIHYDIKTSDYPDYYRFSIVRNPFDRLVSCYESKYNMDKKLLSWYKGRRKDLRFENYLLGYLAKNQGFKHFARRVACIPDWLSDTHFVSQWYLLNPGGRSAVDYVGKLEELPASYESIEEKYALEPLSHYNKTSKCNWMDAYDLETAQWVYKRYARDIQAYGYEGVYRQLLEHIDARERTSSKILARNTN